MNRGFTSVEMIFCLCVTLLLSTLSLSMIQVKDHHLDHQLSTFLTTLQQAKTMAISTHKRVSLQVDSSSYILTGNNYQVEHILDKCYFDNSYSITFNEYGHINKGNTIHLCDSNTCKSIIFHIESGHYYVAD